MDIDIEKQLSRLGKDIQQLVSRVVPLNAEEGDFYPACDIAESSSQYKICIDLPGVAKEHVKVSQKDQVITISGERTSPLKEGEHLKRNERKFGAFTRSYALPGHVDSSSISAKFIDGVLIITLSKRKQEQDDSFSVPIE